MNTRFVLWEDKSSRGHLVNWRNHRLELAFIVLGLIIVLPFQNCARKSFRSKSSSSTQSTTTPSALTDTPSPGTSALSTPRAELSGQYFSYVATQAVAEAVFLQIGTVFLNENGLVSGTVWAEDTRSTDYWVSADSKFVNPMNVPDPSLLKSSGACSPGYLKMPGLIANPQNVSGTWSLNGNYLVVQMGTLVMTWQKDNDFSSDAWKLIMATNHYNTYGYAFVSKQTPLAVTAPLTDNNLASYYSGNLDHNNTGQPFGSWLSVPLAFNWFGRTSFSDPDVVSATSYTNPNSPAVGDGSSIYGYYNISRNDRNRSRNMLFEYFGHDYNDDGCANESGGHARLLYGVFDEASQKITRLLLVESSGSNSGVAGPVPIISVGRAK